MSQGILAAFQQAGRPVPFIADIAAQKGFAAYWRDNASKGYKAVGTVGGATSAANLTVKTILRMLAGQGPKINQFIWRHPLVTDKTLKNYVKAAWTPDTIGTVENPKPTWSERRRSRPVLHVPSTQEGYGVLGLDRVLGLEPGGAPRGAPPVAPMDNTLPSPAESPTAAGVAPLVRTADLAKAFGATQALRSCTFDLRAGEVHAVVGENGSGKSTLVKILTGVHRPDSGTIDVLGREEAPQLAEPRRSRRGIVTVFQEVLVVEPRSVLENVWLGTDGLVRARRSRARSEQRAEALLDELLGTRIALDTGGRGALALRPAGDLHRARPRPRAEGADPRRGDVGPGRRDARPPVRDRPAARVARAPA